MPQDQKTKHAYEHTAKLEKEEREAQAEDDALNDAVLHADSHAGQHDVMPPAEDDQTLVAADNKDVYALLPDFHKDELRRLQLVSPGTRLQMGDVYCDLRDRGRGELTAHGEETVGEELLIAKRGTDYEIWNKLTQNAPSPQ